MSKRKGIINKIEPDMIIWTIKRFSSLSNGDDYPMYHSPSFLLADEKWYFYIFPNGNEMKNAQGYISLYLYRVTFQCEMDFDISLGFKTLDGENYVKHDVFNTLNSKQVLEYCVDKCVKRSELFERKSKLLPNDAFTVFCKLKYPDPVEDTSNIPSCVSAPKPLKILQDFKQLYLGQMNTDVVFMVKGIEIGAHRAILAARSSVFKSTFRNSKTEKITVVGFDPCTFSYFLQFLYCGDVSIISPQNVTDLYIASFKYGVVDLKEECLTFMKENINVENFCGIMTLAVEYAETDLVNLSSSFFMGNAEKITKTVNWELFVKQYPNVSNALFMKFMESVSTSKT